MFNNDESFEQRDTGSVFWRTRAAQKRLVVISVIKEAERKVAEQKEEKEKAL